MMVLDGDVSTLVSTEPARASSYHERKLAGLCTRCGQPALEDNQLCAEHAEDQRRRTAASNERRRRANRKAGKCADCGAASETYRCPACRIACGTAKRRGANTGENKSSRVAANTSERTLASDLGRTRYHGHGKRGRLKSSDIDRQDLEDAAKAIVEGNKNLVFAKSPEVQQLPKIQRLEASRAALARVYYGIRFALEVLARHKVDVTDLVLSVAKTET